MPFQKIQNVPPAAVEGYLYRGSYDKNYLFAFAQIRPEPLGIVLIASCVVAARFYACTAAYALAFVDIKNCLAAAVQHPLVCLDRWAHAYTAVAGNTF